MNPHDEPRQDATLKNLPDEAQEELWQLHKPDDPQADPMPLEEMLGEIPLRHGFTVGKTTFYDWRSWYAVRRRLRAARERARQAELAAAQDGTLDPDAIARVGQYAFTAEAVDGENVKAFVALEKLRLRQKMADLDERRLELMERKAEAFDKAERGARELREGSDTMQPDEQRAAILDRFDEALGLGKTS